MKKLKQIVCCLVTVMTLMMCFSIGAFADAAAAPSGTIVIKNDKAATNVSIVGKEYSAYKIFDLVQNEDHTAFAYTLSSEFKGLFTSSAFTTAFPDAAVNESKTSTIYNFVSGLDTAAQIEKFANTVYDYINSKTDDDAIAATKTATGAASAVTGETDIEYAAFEQLPLGYYVIFGTGASLDNNSEVVTACALDTTTWDTEDEAYTITIDVKVGVPTLEKKIVLNKGKETESLVDVDSANIGDTVDFRVTSSVPDVTGFTKYTLKMTDTMSAGLTPVNAEGKLAVTVKVGEDTIAADKYTVTNTVNADKTTTITVEFNDFYALAGVKNAAYAVGTPITFDYSAVLNADAVIAPEANPNTAKITYSNNPHTAGTPDATTNDTPDDTVNVYTFKLDVFKFTGEDKTPLADAQFTVKNADGEAVSFVLENGKYRVATEDDTNTTTTVISDATGYIYAEGLKAGTYTVTETKAPDGYNLLEADIEFKIEPEYVKNGNTLEKLTAPAEGAAYTLIQKSDDSAAENSGVRLDVENSTGTELPGTGGMGTVLIYVVGGVLIAIAVISVTVRKLANKKQ